MASMCYLQLLQRVAYDMPKGLPSVLQVRQPGQAQTCLFPSTLLRFGATSSVQMRKSLLGNGLSLPLWHIPTQVVPNIYCSINSHTALSLAKPKETVVLLVKIVASSVARAVKTMHGSYLFCQCAPAVGLMIFAMWGLGPISRFFHHAVLKRDNRHWKKSQTHYIISSFLRPLLLWVGIIMICRSFDPIVLSTEASQVIKQRVLNFVRSLSTVLSFAYCAASLTQRLQKFVMEREGTQDSRNLGVQFIGNTVYTAVWVAAVCLFMELLGFSTQRWLTAGGLGTVLLTLAGREIFTNFLSSIMIHATRPFVQNEWIQTKIEGYEVSGTVEHVGWWSPTIIRGDDREAVHIPNHKFTVSVVRNLSQKTHWRIKTHIGISHLDASKIPSIVSDMRKVLAKHPQVEQKRLHRRVFFDNLDPENQSLLILVSCFVKTSHFEEYLRVKEIILLELLKVINHHHARLATPIRSMQRLLDDNDSRHAPFRDMNARSGDTQGRPFLLIDTSSIVSKQREVEPPSNQIKGTSLGKEGTITASDGPEPVSVNESRVIIESNLDLKSSLKQKEFVAAEARSKAGDSSVDASSPSSMAKPQLEGLDSMGLNSNDITLLGAAFEKPPAKILEGPVDSGPFAELPQKEKSMPRSSLEKLSRSSGIRAEKISSKASSETDNLSLESGQEKASATAKLQLEGDLLADTKRSQPHGKPTPSLPASPKQVSDSASIAVSPVTRPQPEANLVLEVALDGPKRMLPIDNEVAFTTEQKEFVASCNGNGRTVRERRDGSQATLPSSGSSDVRERER
eukprot:c27424_g1_i1 orf=782-3163(+)